MILKARIKSFIKVENSLNGRITSGITVLVLFKI